MFRSKVSWFALAFTAILPPLRAGAQVPQTIAADADASVRIICRNDYAEAECLTPLGANNPNGEDKFIRVHDQNQLESGYWHFDLKDLSPGSTVNNAHFQLDSQTNSWGDTTVSVFAIVRSDADWDLTALPEDQINGVNAPKSDYESFAWTGDPDLLQRFNAPTPFLDEGDTASAEVRQLAALIKLDNQDRLTTSDPNDYGVSVPEDQVGQDGSADGETNIWPVKNAVDIDVTDLVKWKMGQNPGYSTFNPTDTELSILVRTDFPEAGGDNGFVRFISKESDFLGGALDLAPGRLVVTTTGGGPTGDFDADGDLDAADIDALSAEVLAGTNQAAFDLTGDAKVMEDDRVRWVNDLKRTYFGDANLDGEFNSSDFVFVFSAGQYEDATNGNSTWATGDWNGDKDFNSSDFVTAFQAGGYELGPRASVSAVPEPAASLLWLGGLMMIWMGRRRR